MINKKEILNTFNYRHACKIFDENKKISDDDFYTIIEAARLSPSSLGLEPWKFLLVQDMEKRKKLLEVTWGGQKQIPTASHLIIALAKKSYFMKYDSQYISDFMTNIQKHPEEIRKYRLKMIENFQKNDFELLKDERYLWDWASKQTYIPFANMMTVAAMLKIDTCPIEGFNRKKLDEILNKHFNVDTDKYSVSYMLTFGYRLNEQPLKTRQKLEDILEVF